MSGTSVFRARALRLLLVGALCCALVPAVAIGQEGEAAGSGKALKAPPGAAIDAQGHPYVADELIVKFKPGVSASAADSINAKLGGRVVAEAKGVRGMQKIKLPKGVTAEKAARSYRQTQGVAYAQPNYLHSISVMPDDPRLPDLWGMNNEGQTGGTEDADIDAPEAWDVQTGSDQVVVAVIDTGVDYRHPDLADNMWTNTGEIAGNGLDDDGNGYVDDIYGYDFFNYDSDPMDDHAHGTHCSGTIGAVANNGIGVAGVAWDVKIMAVKFLSADGWGDTWGAVDSIYYADMMGADIMSNSWGGGPWEQVLYDAIASTDALFVAAAGNDMSDTDQFPNYPSGYELPNVLSVGATDHNDQIAWFSNWGAETVDVFAPGDEVLSTVAGPPPSFDPVVVDSFFVSACDDAGDWNLGSYNSKPWEVSTTWFSSEPAALAHLQYRDNENSWAYLNDTVDLSAMAAPWLRFQAFYEIEHGFDFLNAWASADGSNWTKVASLTGYSGGWDSPSGFTTIDCDLSDFAGDSDVYLAFSFESDYSMDSKWGYIGAVVDDIEIVELATYLSDDFTDLAAWDASEFVNQPWALTTEFMVSGPSAAGVINYDNNEDAWLKLASPLDLSGAAAELALTFDAFYYTDPGLDIMTAYASTDGAAWTELASYSGFSGMYEPGFESKVVDLSTFAGESQVYLAFRFTSDAEWAAVDGLIGVAIDDLTVLEGGWTEADYTNAYEYFSGTSMATPHVSGIAALVLSEWPGATGLDLKNAVMAGADYLPQLDGMCVTGGRANAARSLSDVFGPVITDDNTGSYVGRAEITLTATDDAGVASISYAFGDDEPTTVFDDVAVAVSTVPTRFGSLTYWGEDLLGNVSEPVTVDFELLRGDPATLRVAGSDRWSTAVAASEKAFPDGAGTVVIATGRNWPDALGGTALAGVVDGPILLTDTMAAPGIVLDEVERLGASQAYVLGGTSAVSEDVVGQLEDLMGPDSVTRLAGDDRYQTAEAIAAEVIALHPYYDGMVLVATGANYPDALAAAPIATHRGWPIVLASPSGALAVPEEASQAVILGGTGVVSTGMEAALTGLLGEWNVVRRGGADRYATAALISAYGVSNGLRWEGVGIATGTSFADALAGGAMLGQMRSPLLLTPGDALSPSARAPLSVNRRSIQTVNIIGGPSAVSETVRSQVLSAIR
ncbi:MAG: cell wall-binding repeat-containing protein [Aeromicrobium sp.]|nr:cell wall-binding repeat-containing protein [Aeromicrobium sp.]